MAAIAAAIIASAFLVNLSYPEWSGGWSTGPRLLVPMFPFAMLPVAALLAVGGRSATAIAAILAVAGVRDLPVPGRRAFGCRTRPSAPPGSTTRSASRLIRAS